VKALRVLVVEDEALIGAFLAELLEGMGHGVCAVERTEADAVTAAARFGPDLMIVDAHLRDGSGVAAVEQILRTGFVPHVFISGDTLLNEILNPAAVVLRKPFADVELARAIQRALAARRKSSAAPF
jgi:CheY-like chemotaxis protein